MATSRKKSTGFTAPKEEEAVTEFLEENAREMFETISQTESEAEAETGTPELFIPQEIIPTEDAGPRFIEDPEPLPPEVKPTPLESQPTSKRHPRNVPKFSRLK